ncbi:NrfD/PsrC family molybdoenzyme membrane anchor subunit [Streptosporangium sp. NPDC049046]|uniref:NrfD/PsrC family molybdoenzyme membrane anchor subunit n=1 Tax=Streptosporangium sp. NPDC049046 TaxID=3155031 RepID=UPI00343A5926
MTVAWGPLLAVYVVLVGLPTGLTLMTWWVGRSGETARLERMGTWGALLALVAISLLLVVDLGRPERFHLMLVRFDNLASPISWGAKLIALKILLLLLVLYAIERRRLPEHRPLPRVTSVVAGLLLAVSLALALYPAALLARSWASPLAGSSGVLFLLTALLMGAAVIVLAGADGRTALLGLLAASVVALAMEALALAGRPTDRALLAELVSGDFALLFWGLAVGTGLVLPAAGLLALPRTRLVTGLCAVAVLVGAAATRYLLFAVGS